MLFSQRDRSDVVYLVESGVVELARRRPDGRDELLAVCTPGDYFGELGPLMGLPRAATARARQASRLTALGVRDFREMVGQDGLAQLMAAGEARA